MNSHPVEGRLAAALAAHARTFSASPDAWQRIQAKNAGLSGQRRRRPGPHGTHLLTRHRAFVLPAAAAATVVAVALGATALTHGFSGTAAPGAPGAPAHSATGKPTPSTGPRAVTSNGCAGPPPVRPLPVWARAGFHPPDQPMPQVMGKAGNIIAILFANPLYSPPLRDRNNKILWVSKTPLTGAPLVIKATLAGGTRTATATVPGGPGPSIINLPAPGCWTFHLSWSGHTDQLKLRYVP